MFATLRILQALFNAVGAPKQILIGMHGSSPHTLFVEVYWDDEFKCRIGITGTLLENDEQWAVKTLIREINYKYQNRKV